MNFLWYQVIYERILTQGWEKYYEDSWKTFAGLSVMTVAELLQLSPVKGILIFSQFSDKDSMKHLLGLQLWHLFKYAELTEL